jgi:hypothetical protein
VEMASSWLMLSDDESSGAPVSRGSARGSSDRDRCRAQHVSVPAHCLPPEPMGARSLDSWRFPVLEALSDLMTEGGEQLRPLTLCEPCMGMLPGASSCKVALAFCLCRHTHTHTYEHACVHTHTHTHAHTALTHEHSRTNSRTQSHTYTNAYRHAHTHTHTSTQAHAHTHTHLKKPSASRKLGSLTQITKPIKLQ